MATHRIIESTLNDDVFDVYGDGSQRRDFTYVTDVARANIAAGMAEIAPGTVLNVAGGTDTSLNELLAVVGDVVGHPVRVRYGEVAAGDVYRTGGQTEETEALLGWRPLVGIEEGIEAQVAWHAARSEAAARRPAAVLR